MYSVFQFGFLLFLTASASAALFFRRSIPVYARIAILPLLLTLAEGGFHFEDIQPIRQINLGLHLGVAALACFAALPRRVYRESILRLFTFGSVAYLIFFFFAHRDQSESSLLRAAVHIIAAAGAVLFYTERIRPPFENPQSEGLSLSFWVVGAFFSYHIIRLTFMALPIIGEQRENGLSDFFAYSADWAASSVYALLILIGALFPKRYDFQRHS